MSPVVDLDFIHGAVVAILAAATAVLAFVRGRWWNAKDALQKRLAAHIEAYVGSDQGEDDRMNLSNALKTEFRQRAVVHEERGDRVWAAFALIKPRLTLPQIASLTSTLEKMGYTA